ncbi:MAG: response regulator [Bacteroidales bacterium]|nr:response regulator [Bacteroidales bacterium]
MTEPRELILIIDDEYSNRLLLEELLSDYEVITADSGESMWRILEVRHPALILMDVMMPEEDGFSLAKSLGNSIKYRDIPIIFVTAKVTGKDIETGFDVGGYDYIKKPFNQLELESRIKLVLQKKRLEKKLIKKSITADKIIQNMYDGLLVIDPTGLIIDTNPSVLKMLSYEKNEVLLKDISELSDENLKDFLKNEKSTFNIESVLRTKLGIKFPVSLSLSAIFDETDELSGWVAVVHDISSQKLTEQKLIDAKNKAEQADKLKSVFLANMSHEIRTPMNSIIGFSELLEDDDISDTERKEYVGIIQKNGDKLLNFIDNLLDISIIESGQIQISKSNCYLNQVLDELLASFTVIKKRRDKEHLGLKLSKAVADNNFTIFTDGYRFQQIMMNLLINAIKFTKQGEIVFGYEMIDEIKSIKFFVKDTGVGIPSDKLDYIFDRFAQVEYKGIENQSGTGLGLAISRNLAEILGGKLSLISEVGIGTIFYLILPLK